MSTTPVAVGDVIAGKLTVERVLGKGGMGVVVAARHEHLDERVAVKLLLPEIAQSEEFAQRFLREARAAVRIKSEHVARVMDVGTLEGGVPYMVMEYLEGEDLENLVARQGPLSVQEAVDCIVQACDAIAEAHASGIVHRDLKPSNLFRTVRPDGSAHIKVLDFGISKQVSTPDTADQRVLTKTGGVMGSPAFMSPEQIRSTRNVDARTDIWALGVILYHLLTANSPFPGESVGELFAAILEKPPIPVEAHRPDLPAQLSQAIHRCIERDPSKRPATVAQFVESIVWFASDGGKAVADRIQRYYGTDAEVRSVVRPSAGGPQSLDELSVAKTLATGDGEVRAPGRGRLYAIVVAVVLALVLGLGLALARAPGGDVVVSDMVSSVAVSSLPAPEVPPQASGTPAAVDAASTLTSVGLDASAPAASVTAPVRVRASSGESGPKSGTGGAKPVADPVSASTPKSGSKGGLDGLIDERR
jgi:serine/threonine-protein kinase